MKLSEKAIKIIKKIKIVLRVLLLAFAALMFLCYGMVNDDFFLGCGVVLVLVFIISLLPIRKRKKKSKGGKYQIFVSYRRGNGSFLAGRVVDRLRLKGYKVFFDVESMNSGTFNEQIFKAIDECKDFIVVLQAGSLDRCVNTDDWVRKEIEYALAHNKNIIPIWTHDFDFPENIPESIRVLQQVEGVALSTEYFDAFVERVDNFLKCK